MVLSIPLLLAKSRSGHSNRNLVSYILSSLTTTDYELSSRGVTPGPLQSFILLTCFQCATRVHVCSPPSLTLQLWLVNKESAVFHVYTSSQPNMCGKHSMWPGWENLNSLSTSTARPRLIWQRQGDPNHECEFGLGTLGIAQHTAWRDIKHGTCTPRAVFQPESPSVLGSQVTTRGLTSAVLLLPS